MATLTTLGIPQLDRRLALLATREANKISRKAINRGLTVLAQAERSAVDSAPVSPELRRALKKTVGKRLVLKGGPKIGAMAKAGFGVGQNPKGAKAKARKAAKVAGTKAGRADRSAAGVGISANNVHWFALGTQPRYQGARKSQSKARKNGQTVAKLSAPKFVGRIQPTEMIRKAASSLGRVFTTIEASARDELDKAVNALRNG